MKKYLFPPLVLLAFTLSYAVFADEVAKKTDGSFAGWDDGQKPINSSFMGDISNSMVNEAWGKEDISKKTDSGFAGEDAIEAQNSYFAGASYQQQVRNSTVDAFAGEDAFVGNSYGK